MSATGILERDIEDNALGARIIVPRRGGGRCAIIPALSNVPTVTEAGLAKMELTVWHGIYAPRGTPPEVTQRLTSALKTALLTSAVVERFRQLSALPVLAENASPDALKAKLTAEIQRWKPMLDKEAAR